MIRRAVRWATLSASLLLVPLALAAQGLTPEQVVSLRSVGATALSPDGRWVAYTVTQPRDSAEERGSAYAELYIMPAAGGEARLIVAAPRAASAPKWAPDGARLGFIAQLPGDDRRQVYAVPAAGGEPQRLTTFGASVGDFAWSPDGASIAFTASRMDPRPTRDPRNDVIVTSEQGTWTRLYAQPLTGGEAAALTPPRQERGRIRLGARRPVPRRAGHRRAGRGRGPALPRPLRHPRARGRAP